MEQSVFRHCGDRGHEIFCDEPLQSKEKIMKSDNTEHEQRMANSGRGTEDSKGGGDSRAL